jgi:predicted nucleic acid-binding protein
LYRQAFRLSRRYEIHPYEAAIVAAALELGAYTLDSEGLSDGQEYDGVKVVNPFLLFEGRSKKGFLSALSV